MCLFQRLAGDHLLLQLQHTDSSDHADPDPHVHRRGHAVLHRPHQGKYCTFPTEQMSLNPVPAPASSFHAVSCQMTQSVSPPVMSTKQRVQEKTDQSQNFV